MPHYTMQENIMALEIFISYSHRDKKFRRELEIRLINLRHQQDITAWHDGEISPGTEWKQQVMEHLHTAQIILLLVSPDYMASDFCYGVEMTQAIARHDANQSHVIPIILRPTDFRGAPFAKLKLLPTDGKPITEWPTRDKAFQDIALGIWAVVDDLIKKRTTANRNVITSGPDSNVDDLIKKGTTVNP
jgi:hypothetical protein